MDVRALSITTQGLRERIGKALTMSFVDWMPDNALEIMAKT